MEDFRGKTSATLAENPRLRPNAIIARCLTLVALGRSLHKHGGRVNAVCGTAAVKLMQPANSAEHALFPGRFAVDLLPAISESPSRLAPIKNLVRGEIISRCFS